MSDEWMLGILGAVLGLVYNVTFPDGGKEIARLTCQVSAIGMMVCMFWLGRMSH